MVTRHADGPAPVYMAYQSLNRAPKPSDLTRLRPMLDEDLAAMGYTGVTVLNCFPWKAFSRLSPEALAGGMLQSIFRSQGKNRTVFLGACLSYDAVAHVMAYNQEVINALGLKLQG